MRAAAAFLAAITALASIAAAVWHPMPRLVWNASASVPVGLYAVHPLERLDAGELVVVQPTPAVAKFLDARGYLPRGVPMLKHVAALPGQTICRTDLDVAVDEVLIGAALKRDHLGRPLPSWKGCRVLRSGEVFLMNRNVPTSLDSRYFGALPASAIVGRAVPVWLPK